MSSSYRPRLASYNSNFTTTSGRTPSPEFDQWDDMPGSSRATSSSATTLWSDDPTEMPKPASVRLREDYLIDLDNDDEEEEVGESTGMDRDVREPSPAEKLKLLLKQMDEEIRDTSPVKATVERLEQSTSRSAWRDGRRRRNNGSREISADQEPSDSERYSPPTPPIRFSASSKRTSVARVPSRAAVLQASISRPAPESSHSPTPLETFVTNSRSFDHSGSSTSSRKGKERAVEFASPAHSPATPGNKGSHMTRRRIPTPKRWSVDLAPDADSFAEHAGDLEVRGEMELDIEESAVPPWDSEESGPEPDTSSSRRRVRIDDQTVIPDQIPRSTPQRPYRSAPVATPPLPALPQPSDTDSEDDYGDTLSSRRAAMFRSPGKSIRSPDMASKRFAGISRSDVSSSRTSPGKRDTPVRTPPMPQGQPTPQPPGKWFSPSNGTPIRHTSRPSMDSVGTDEVSVHRIKMSPAKSPLRAKEQEIEAGNSSFLTRIRLSRSPSKQSPKQALSYQSMLQPSSTLREAQEALARASSLSKAAQLKVETTQNQWLNALAAAQKVGDGAAMVAKRTWGWSTLAWWLSIEMLLVWGVFRVTLDYASSAAFLASLDPFSPTLSRTNLGLSIPLPSAVSAFIVPHRGSANFFDLLEQADLWRKFETLGVIERLPGETVVKMLGGVPT